MAAAGENGDVILKGRLKGGEGGGGGVIYGARSGGWGGLRCTHIFLMTDWSLEMAWPEAHMPPSMPEYLSNDMHPVPAGTGH